MTGPALLAPDRPNGLYETRTVMSRPYRARQLTPTPIGGVVLTPVDLESGAASRWVRNALDGPTPYQGDRRVLCFHQKDGGRCSGCWTRTASH